MTPPRNAARSRVSAGLLPYRVRDGLEVFAGHLGGPLWARRDEHAGSIVKGEHPPEEDPADAARREWTEETGLPVPPGPWLDLGEVRQSGGKVVRAFAVEAPDLDPQRCVSNTFELEWPPRSGRVQHFPELDRFAWLTVPEAARKLVKAQTSLLPLLPTPGA